MNIEKLTDRHRSIRRAIRNFLLAASPEELAKELKNSQESGDTFRAECVQEIMDEDAADIRNEK